MQTLLNVYYLLPPQAWAFLFGTPAIVIFLNVCKKLLGDKKSTVLVHLLNVTTSYLLVAIPTYILNNPKPWSWLGAYTAAFFTAANLLYAIVKVLAPFFREVKAYEDKAANRVMESSGAALPTGYTYVNAPAPTTVTSGTMTSASTVQDPTVFEG